MGQQILEEQATPATPAANKVSLYPKPGGGVYKISDDGVEHQLLTDTGQQTIPTINLTGGQIAFPATAVPSADPNTIDDYEEGTYTITVTPATSGTVTLSSANDLLSYVKIGPLVTVTGHFAVSSVSSPVGQLQFLLPFTVTDLAETAGRSVGSVSPSQFDIDTNVFQVNPYAIEGHAYFRIREIVDNSAAIIFGTTNTLSGNEEFYVFLPFLAA